ncbi:hypothetical protein [Fictibacillus phosphorivorans]|uniref:hypothetical protein n=1 Tax=Fictibacillus phosphorivorans TaxID=1221500 RepID=UPI000A88C0B5|nr:hypothetical protein [Fictibacillus phosphorivorans]
MNKTLSTFLGIAVTVLAISGFLFFFGYNMIGTETGEYETTIDSMNGNLPNGTTTTNTP